jgi:hypothetical protein
LIPHPDRYAEFSNLLTQIKFILLELVIFLGFLIWFVKHVVRDVFGLYRYVRRLWRDLRRDDGVAAVKTPAHLPQGPT